MCTSTNLVPTPLTSTGTADDGSSYGTADDGSSSRTTYYGRSS
ncbi:hypothetical protein Tco_0509062, partial [Tanacetum coccineum]